MTLEQLFVPFGLFSFLLCLGIVWWKGRKKKKNKSIYPKGYTSKYAEMELNGESTTYQAHTGNNISVTVSTLMSEGVSPLPITTNSNDKVKKCKQCYKENKYWYCTHDKVKKKKK